MSGKDEAGTSRRDFLKLAGTTAPVAAAVTLTGGTRAEAAEPDLSLERIQDTAHTRAFYDTARF